MSEAQVRVLGPEDVLAGADVLARGFDQEPAKLALLPDARARRAVLEMSTRVRVREAARRGTAHAALVGDGPAGVAVWVPPGTREMSLVGGARFAGRALLTLRRLARAIPGLVSVMRTDVRGMIQLVRERRHAVKEASRGQAWSLVLIATLEEHRGKGLGRALLDYQLHRCDEDSAAAWLETTDPVNVPLYERFGFETVARLDGPGWLPGSWVMRREPRG